MHAWSYQLRWQLLVRRFLSSLILYQHQPWYKLYTHKLEIFNYMRNRKNNSFLSLPFRLFFSLSYQILFVFWSLSRNLVIQSSEFLVWEPGEVVLLHRKMGYEILLCPSSNLSPRQVKKCIMIYVEFILWLNLDGRSVNILLKIALIMKNIQLATFLVFCGYWVTFTLGHWYLSSNRGVTCTTGSFLFKKFFFLKV